MKVGTLVETHLSIIYSGGRRLRGHANNCPTVTIPHPSAAKGHPLPYCSTRPAECEFHDIIVP